MKIGIDIDGVLTKSGLLKNITKFKLCLHKKLNIKYKNPEDSIMRLPSIFLKIGTKAISSYFKHQKVRPDASDAVKLLKKYGHKIYIITNRPTIKTNGNIIKETTEKWLKQNDIYYDEILYSNGSKASCVSQSNVDFMIEDSIKNIEEIKNLTKTIFFSDYATFEDEKVLTAKNWADVCKLIKNFETANYNEENDEERE